jgi:hypothetical protein
MGKEGRVYNTFQGVIRAENKDERNGCMFVEERLEKRLA